MLHKAMASTLVIQFLQMLTRPSPVLTSAQKQCLTFPASSKCLAHKRLNSPKFGLLQLEKVLQLPVLGTQYFFPSLGYSD